MEQQKFIETVEKIKESAQTNGGKIRQKEIDEKLRIEGMELNESQLKMVYAYLKTSKIQILDEEDVPEEKDTENPLEKNPGNVEEESTETELEENVQDMENREDEFVRLYQADLKDIPVLTEEELLEVMKRLAADKNKADMEAVINTFLKDVVRWVKNYREGAVLMTDLIQEGNMGLMEGVESFDYGQALNLENPVKKLRDFLRKSVIKAVQDAIYTQESENNVGYKISGRVNAVNDCARELAEDLGRKVTMEELAEKMDMTFDEIKEIVDFSSNKIEYIQYS